MFHSVMDHRVCKYPVRTHMLRSPRHSIYRTQTKNSKNMCHKNMHMQKHTKSKHQHKPRFFNDFLKFSIISKTLRFETTAPHLETGVVERYVFRAACATGNPSNTRIAKYLDFLLQNNPKTVQKKNGVSPPLNIREFLGWLETFNIN